MTQLLHPIRRARDHYGLAIDLDIIRAWEDRVRRGLATFLRREAPEVAVYRLEHEGSPIRVVVGPVGGVSGRIITVLPIKDGPAYRPRSRAEKRREWHQEMRKRRST